MFNIGDRVKNSKMGIGTVIKAGRFFSTVNFDGKNKLLSNNSLVLYIENEMINDTQSDFNEQISLFENQKEELITAELVEEVSPIFEESEELLENN